MSKQEFICKECGYYFHKSNEADNCCPVCESGNVNSLLEEFHAKNVFGSKHGGCGGGGCGGGCNCKH